MRIVQSADTLTFAMREYLDVIRTRYERVLRQSSSAASRASVLGRPVADPAVLKHVRVGSTAETGHVRVPFVLGPAGERISDNAEICRTFEHYFRLFFQSELNQSVGENSYACHVREFCGILPSVPSHLQERLCAPVMATELWEVLADMRDASAPGPDGIPCGILQAFLPGR